MPKLVLFPANAIQHAADSLLALTASRERLSKPEVWPNRPTPPEPLGNMLQRLALKRPIAVLVLENLVADLLKQLGP